MAAFDAIAAASRSLRRLLLDRMTTAAAVTLAPPDILPAGINSARVNLYLFEVQEHAGLRNQPFHPRERDSGHPPLSLTLRYLLTTHPLVEDLSDSDLIAQSLLGDALLTLHDLGGRIEELALLTNRAGAIGERLLDPSLAGEPERLKITLHPASSEELTKLFSAMPNTNFRRAAVVDVSVIQLEPRLPRRAVAPVERRRILATVAAAPRIRAAYRSPPPPPADMLRDLRIRVGDELTIEHDGGLGDRLYLRLGTLEPIRIALPTNGIIRIALPDAALPPDLDNPLPRPIPPGGELQPGTLEIALIAESDADAIEGALDRGAPVPVTRALRSNSALLQLAPALTALSAANGTAADILTITGTRLFAETLVCEVLVGEAIIPIRPPEPGEPFAAPTPTAVEIPVAALAAVVAPGPALMALAVQVNGVRSMETGFTFRLDP